MTTTKNQTPTNNKSKDVIKSLAWLIEAAFRGFVGWVLLDHFHNYIMVAVAIYSLLTAGLIVIVHFVNAHKA
jgi:hypothetical protein